MKNSCEGDGNRRMSTGGVFNKDDEKRTKMDDG